MFLLIHMKPVNNYNPFPADQGFLKRIYFAVGSNKNTVK